MSKTHTIRSMFPGHPPVSVEVVSGKGAGLRVVGPADLAERLDGRVLPSRDAVRWEAETLWGKRWKRKGRNNDLTTGWG